MYCVFRLCQINYYHTICSFFTAAQICDGTYWELYVGLMIGGGTANAATTEALCLSACEVKQRHLTFTNHHLPSALTSGLLFHFHFLDH